MNNFLPYGIGMDIFQRYIFWNKTLLDVNEIWLKYCAIQPPFVIAA